MIPFFKTRISSCVQLGAFLIPFVVFRPDFRLSRSFVLRSMIHSLSPGEVICGLCSKTMPSLSDAFESHLPLASTPTI